MELGKDNPHTQSREVSIETTEFTDDYHFKLVRKIADGGMGSVYEAVLYGSEGFEKQIKYYEG